MPAPILFDDIVNAIRDQTDESSTSYVTEDDILQSIARGQDYAADILARQYPDPLLDEPIVVPLVMGQFIYDFPEGILESRIVGVEATNGSVVYPMQRINHSDLHIYESSGKSMIPYVYAVVGNKYWVKPTPGSSNAMVYSLRLWILKELETPVLQQGRITRIDVAAGKIYLDSAGGDLSTESDNLNSYINVADAQTGLIKASFQIKTKIDNVLTIKAVPDRTAVYAKTVATTIPTTVEIDDYVCNVRGTCVPYLKKPFVNFVIQFATIEVKRRLGEDVTQELIALKAFEDQVEHSWVGRELTLRVGKRSKHWVRPSRRWLGST